MSSAPARALALPDGRQGKALAIGMTLLGVALVWFALLSPLLGWYQSRSDQLAQQRMLGARMAALAGEIPQMRAALAARPQSQDRQILLTGGTDEIAGANLQSALQTLATQAGTSLDSAEMMPVQAQGALRYIGVQVSVTAPWPVLIALLQNIGTALPRMVVGQLSLMNASEGEGADPPVQASFSVSAFRSGSP